MASALYGFFIVSLIGFSMMLLLFFILFIIADFSKLEQWFEEKYDADVMFSDDVFYPDNKDEWIYRFGVESSPQGKRGQAQIYKSIHPCCLDKKHHLKTLRL